MHSMWAVLFALRLRYYRSKSDHRLLCIKIFHRNDNEDSLLMILAREKIHCFPSLWPGKGFTEIAEQICDDGYFLPWLLLHVVSCTLLHYYTCTLILLQNPVIQLELRLIENVFVLHFISVFHNMATFREDISFI